MLKHITLLLPALVILCLCKLHLVDASHCTSYPDCAAGRYSSSGKSSDCYSSTCIACPTGYLSSTGKGSNQSACTLCAAGYEGTPIYSDGKLSGCNSCEVGKYKKNPNNALSCINCPLGTYAENRATVTCTNCLAGRYMLDTLST